MEFTGERMVIGQTDIELEIEHVNRYKFASQFTVGKDVLDAACGTGYGSAIMAKYAKSVKGIDISQEAVDYATDKFGDANINFTAASVDNMPFKDSAFDVVVSFETIEHVNEKMQNDFLKEVKRVIKSGGVFVVSTPNHTVYKEKCDNHFHVKELDYDEFKFLLESKFKNVRFYSQMFEVSNAIVCKNDSIGNVVSGIDPSTSEYLVAVCSDSEIDNINSEIFVRKDNKLKNIMEWAIGNHNTNERNNAVIAENTEKIQKLNNELENKNNSIEQFIKNEEKLNKQIQEHENLSNKIKAEAERLKVEAEKSKAETEVLKQDIDKQNTMLKNKDGHIELLLEREREFERLKGSRAWKIMQFIWKFSSVIFPKGSKRRLLAKMLWKFIKHPLVFIRKINGRRIRMFFYYLKKEGPASVSRRLDESVRGAYVQKTELKVEKSEFSDNIEDYEKISVPIFKEPEVTIIIPVYNQFGYTYGCIKSIVENSRDVSYEIIIANDCSTDITKNINEVISGINVITNKKNLRFLKNCNNAAHYAKGKYILFLNNDTQVQENWLAPLKELIERDSNIGMVGSKLVYPDGKLQEAGGIFWNDASAWNYGNLSDPNASEYNYVKETDYISGASIMIRKSLWDEIGGFDERFAPAYYEDSDLAFEVRKHGYKVMYQPLSVVVHFEGTSNGTDTSTGQKAYQVINQKKFYEKWKDVLEREHFPNGENVFVARDRSRNKKHILVVDHYVPHYDKDAGGKCTFMYIKLFVGLGMRVTFIGDNYFKHEPYTTELNQLGVEVLYGGYYLKNWQNWLKENGGFFDYIYLERAHIAIKYIDYARCYSNAKIIYFNVDMQHIREYREYEITGDKIHLERGKAAEKIEMELSSKADVLHVVGSYEQGILQNIFPNKPIRNIPVYIYEEQKKDVRSPKDRRDLLFVGGFSHQPNVDGVMWFYSEVFPIILDSLPNIKWHIVGSNVPEKIKAFESNNIICHGFVSDEELTELYNTCKVCVAPLRFGAGVKGKVVEAIYNRIPLITTPIGSEGLSTKEKAFYVAEGAEEFAETVKKLYLDDTSCLKLQENCLKFIKNHFTIEIAKKEVLKDIKI